MTTWDSDRLHGAALPAGLSDRAFHKLASRYGGIDTGTVKTAQVTPPPVAPAKPKAPGAAPAAPAEEVEVESPALAKAAGFTAIGTGMYRRGHEVWAMRRSDEGKFVLVRLREERAPDMRDENRGKLTASKRQGLKVGDKVFAIRHGQVMPAMVLVVKDQGGLADLDFGGGMVEEDVPSSLCSCGGPVGEGEAMLAKGEGDESKKEAPSESHDSPFDDEKDDDEPFSS